MTAVTQSNLSISRRALDIEDYIDIARRHVSWIVGPLYASLIIATIVAFFLPNTYVSRALLRITPSQIPENLVPATFNQQMSDRISQMWQEITSRTSLSELIQRQNLDLYKKERSNKPLEDVIEEMKNKDIKIEILGMQQQTGGQKPASAFAISFQYSDRFKAQQVVAAMVSKFTEANFSVQRIGVTQTQELLKDELQGAKTDLDRLDKDLTDFKIAHQGRLPEQLQINVNAMAALQTQLMGVNENLSRNNSQKIMLETSLSTFKSQLQGLQTATDGTSLDDALPPPPGSAAAAKNEELAQISHEIVVAEAQLASMQQSLTDIHPDMVDFKAKLASLKARRDKMVADDDAAEAKAKTAAEANKSKAVPKKRAVPMQIANQINQLQANIAQTEGNLKALEIESREKSEQQKKLTADLNGYEEKINASPANEQQYASLMRERQIAAQRYEELQHKQKLAEQGIEVNNRKAGENLEVLDPASLPETPTAPNRWQIVGFGAIAGLMIGATMAAVKEMKDTSLKNLKDVRAYTNLPVLSSIPLLENALLVRRKRRLAYVAWSIATILGIAGVAISLYYHYTQK